MENQKTTEEKPFKALSRICLNNWHYIDKKVLSFRDGINFFTGHSGSGKSTVIDALPVVLYANTDGHFSTGRRRMIPTEASSSTCGAW